MSPSSSSAHHAARAPSSASRSKPMTSRALLALLLSQSLGDAAAALQQPSHHAAPKPTLLQRPFCIGVAGATASGKSSVVKEIVRLLNAEDRVASVTQDCFYKDLSPEEREQAYQSNYNFDHPNAFDWEQQLSVLQQLRDGGKNVAVPAYDFVTHSRLSKEHDTTIVSPEIVIFEGILAMHDEDVRDLFDLKVFVDADADVRLARRIKRDMEERGRDLSGILEQYERFVKPATETFVVPTKAYADIVVPRGVENVVAIEMLAQHINNVLVQRELAAEAAEQDWDKVESLLKAAP